MDYLTMDENVCPVCGKVFHTFVGRDWGWTYKGSKYCTYHCMRHVEVRHRVAMGWDKATPVKGMEGLTPKAADVARELVKLRALQKAYCGMREAEDDRDVTYAAMAKCVGQLAAVHLAKWQDKFDKLDEGKKRIAYQVFVEAKPLAAVALEMDIDCDLLTTKTHLIYEALARMAV